MRRLVRLDAVLLPRFMAHPRPLLFIIVRAAIWLVSDCGSHNVIGLIKRGNINRRHIAGHVVLDIVPRVPPIPVVGSTIPHRVLSRPMSNVESGPSGGGEYIVRPHVDPVNVKLGVRGRPRMPDDGVVMVLSVSN